MAFRSSQSRNLLITLDAFGTLYRPRKSIALQYLDVARTCGLDLDCTHKSFRRAFRNAFYAHLSRSPNYGKATSMAPETWWANVVTDTFSPFLDQPATGAAAAAAAQRIPDTLAQSLFRHFSTGDGYELFPDTTPFFDQMRGWKRLLRSAADDGAGVQRVVVGVLTNSDPRVASVLESLGVVVGGGGGQQQQNVQTDPELNVDIDVDFVLTSYEIGCEKPSRLAFDAAEQLARSKCGSDDQVWNDAVKVHIGDDLHKDYWGAIRSDRGWDALLLDREADEPKSRYQDVKRITRLTDAQSSVEALITPTQPDAVE